MTLDELAAIPKIDAHAHLMGKPGGDFGPLVHLLERRATRWIDPCVCLDDGSLSDQIAIARNQAAHHPDRFSWTTAFTLEGLGTHAWTERAIAEIESGRNAGAVGVKVWKNIGMTLREDGRFVMIDDERFDPVFEKVRSLGLTLTAHLGEPRNCWLPIEEMTVAGDRAYFATHPQYHGYRIPEMPGYWEQVAARDRMLAKHPDLRVVGCHLASLEFDVAEVAKRLDAHPNLAVDLSARISHLQAQESGKVRRFLIGYQDRILYGTDMAAGYDERTSPEDDAAGAERTYVADERYFATGGPIDAPAVRRGFRCRGLKLPDGVLHKLFHDNALRWYPLIREI
jgi:predicted TIM-barrel fold metal-dependent hydrolase